MKKKAIVSLILGVIMSIMAGCASNSPKVVDKKEDKKEDEGFYGFVVLETYMLDNYSIDDGIVSTSAEGDWGDFEIVMNKGKNCVFTIEDENGNLSVVSEKEIYDLWSDCVYKYSVYEKEVMKGVDSSKRTYSVDDFIGHLFIVIGHNEVDDKIVDEIRLTYNMEIWKEFDSDPRQSSPEKIPLNYLYTDSDSID